MDGSPSLVESYGSTKFNHPGEPGGEPYIRIRFQAGPIQEHGVNGCSIEDVIDVLLTRLRGFQEGPFKCRENALAITDLESAQNWLLRRTANRQRQGVEGTNAPHS